LGDNLRLEFKQQMSGPRLVLRNLSRHWFFGRI
jgi:hypothetical protein